MPPFPFSLSFFDHFLLIFCSFFCSFWTCSYWVRALFSLFCSFFEFFGIVLDLFLLILGSLPPPTPPDPGFDLPTPPTLGVAVQKTAGGSPRLPCVASYLAKWPLFGVLPS